jgi:hypothetical protein
MSLPAPVVKQLQKLLQDNVNRYFGPLKPAEKTPDKVQAFAQNQLDFFINGIVRESPELRLKWVKGHPYHVHLRFDPNTRFYEAELTCDE